MAEGLLKKMVERAGLDTVQVESAGVFALDGMSPTRETQRLLKEAGIDCSSHLARTLTMPMVENADLILAMEEMHIEEILRRVPSAKSKVHILKLYAKTQEEGDPNPNIPDPIGKPLEVYEICFAIIQESVKRIAHTLGVRS